MVEFIVYAWLSVPYNGDPVVVGKFENCDQGMIMVENLYPEAKAVHCITSNLTPPGGVKE